jgi:hypothetical protein
MPVRPMIGVSGKSSLISGRMSPFCHWALEEAIIVGSERLGYRGEADNVALQFGGAGGIRVLASRPTW